MASVPGSQRCRPATCLGQTFHTFADSNDGGRDGAFYGSWLAATNLDATFPSSLADAATVVAQCKFSASGVGTLPPSDLKDELVKAEKLHAEGLCDAYILLTNLRVSGKTEAWLRTELAYQGIDQTMILDGNLICQQISTRPVLRRYVPRVYGLGDLSQILDERRLAQAEVLLSNLGQDLSTFVPTAAYRQAADALAMHGFTILLGAPAAGKSTIAATLAAAALDEWGCGVRRVDSALELIEAWNPHEPDQLFWVDDAFGAIQHDQQLTDQWSRRLDQVMAAISNGAKIILTSRDYIYHQARRYFKGYAYPLLHEQAVVVDVKQLSEEERRQILYNHLRAGDQPANVLKNWRPHLPDVAASQEFQPEVARRLGHKSFTNKIHHGRQLLGYVNHQVDFLTDILTQLEPAARAALACVYLSGDGLPTSVSLSDQHVETVTLLGATTPEVMLALGHLNDTFLKVQTDSHGVAKWCFRHPTVREGFAAAIAKDPNAVRIVLNGLTDDELVKQVDCGGTEAGTLITIPAHLYPDVVSRTPLGPALENDIWYSPLALFLSRRASDEFIQRWASHNAETLPGLLSTNSYQSASWRLRVLGVLNRAKALPHDLRERAVEILGYQAIQDLDAQWLDPDIAYLFTASERRALLDRFTEEVIPQIDDLIDESAEGYFDDVSPAERYDHARETITAYLDAFEEGMRDTRRLDEALSDIESKVAQAEESFEPKTSDSFAPTKHPATAPTRRDPFDDVHIGH